MLPTHIELLLLPFKKKASQIFQRPSKPFALTLATTYICQSRCHTCNIWKLYKKDPKKAQKEISYNDYKALFKNLENDLIFLAITGGEPFLKKDLLELIKLANQKLKKLAFITINTNGISPALIRKKTKNILNFTPYKKISISVSLDGSQKLHDQIRGIPGNYKKAIETFTSLKKLSKKHPNLLASISYTISANNAGQFGAFYHDLKKNLDIDINNIGINLEHQGLQFHNTKKPLQIRKNFLQKLEKDINFILKQQSKKTPSIFLLAKRLFRNFYLHNLPKYTKNTNRSFLHCTAISSSLYIDPYGDIYPCSIWDQKLGNIKTTDFSIFWNSQKLNKARKKIENLNCPTCFLPCQAQYDFILNPHRWFFP